MTSGEEYAKRQTNRGGLQQVQSPARTGGPEFKLKRKSEPGAIPDFRKPELSGRHALAVKDVIIAQNFTVV